MSTDDRDIESSNPSKNFKVGDFDQRSGFFTPVWESKRRIRSEPPAPPSSTSEGARGARAVSSRSAQASDAAAGDAAAGDAVSNGKGSQSSTPRSRSGSGSKSRRGNSARSATPVPPVASEGTPPTLGAAPLPPAVAAVFNPSVELAPLAEASSAAQESAASEGGAGRAAAQRSARPSAATRALQDAGPDLPPGAFLDAEPEFRAHRGALDRDALDRDASDRGASDRDASDRDASGRGASGRDALRRGASGGGAPARHAVPPEERTDRSPAHQRSLRATSAAARVHDQLKARLQAEAAELDESRFDQTPDSQLPPLADQDQESGPYPQSLLRRLRRTIRLSSPVPDPIRSLISKYDRG